MKVVNSVDDHSSSHGDGGCDLKNPSFSEVFQGINLI